MQLYSISQAVPCQPYGASAIRDPISIWDNIPTMPVVLATSSIRSCEGVTMPDSHLQDWDDFGAMPPTAPQARIWPDSDIRYMLAATTISHGSHEVMPALPTHLSNFASQMATATTSDVPGIPHQREETVSVLPMPRDVWDNMPTIPAVMATSSLRPCEDSVAMPDTHLQGWGDFRAMRPPLSQAQMWPPGPCYTHRHDTADPANEEHTHTYIGGHYFD